MNPSPLRAPSRLRCLIAACIGLSVLAPVGAQTQPKAAPAAKVQKATLEEGVEVTVTPEMTGAGQVSSGQAQRPIPPVTGNRTHPVASWGKPLPYPILVADRRNNRLLEIAPDKKILWEFGSPSLKLYRGNEDVNFSPDGRQLAVSEEDNFDIHIIDFETRQITWTYGVPDRRGKAKGLLNYPDDAHILADGMFLTADIRNCRVLIIDPKDKHIVSQWGTPGNLLYVNGMWDGTSALIGSVAAYLILGERLQGPVQYAGLVVIIAGIFMLHAPKGQIPF